MNTPLSATGASEDLHAPLRTASSPQPVRRAENRRRLEVKLLMSSVRVCGCSRDTSEGVQPLRVTIAGDKRLPSLCQILVEEKCLPTSCRSLFRSVQLLRLVAFGWTWASLVHGIDNTFFLIHGASERPVWHSRTSHGGQFGSLCSHVTSPESSRWIALLTVGIGLHSPDCCARCEGLRCEL